MSETPTPVVLRFLADHANWLAHRPECIEAFEELTGVVRLFREAIDSPRLVYAGPCDVCERDMYAREGSPQVECRPCVLVYDFAPRRDWLLGLIDDQLATATDIARGLSDLEVQVPASTIRGWAHRERLLVRGVNRNGDPLYRVGDVMELASRARKDRKDHGA